MYDCQHTDQNNSKSDHAFRSNGCLMQWGSWGSRLSSLVIIIKEIMV
jgi:hypothetical protein